MTVTAEVPVELTPAGVREPIVSLRDVFCVHRTGEGDAAALQGTTLAIWPGELVCVFGPSGAGKSTLLRVIAGLQVPSAGLVQVLGWDIGRLASRLRSRLRHASIGFLPQHADQVLAPDLPARETVTLPLALRREPRASQLTRAAELLDAAGLAPHADALPDQMSGGERQRLALCAALAHRPRLLLADEPTGELDATAAAAVRSLIVELCRASGTTAIVVSHDPDTAAAADRTVRLRDGRVAEDRRPGEHQIVVGRGGWVHLPPELLSAAGIEDRAHVSLGGDGLLVSPARENRGPGGSPIESEPRSPMPGARGSRDWLPVAVETEALARSRGRGARRREVLVNFTHRFEAGRMTAVVGPSGAGKTTLLQLLAGLDQPDAGELLIGEKRLSGADAEQRAALRRRHIGFLPQEPSPIGFLSAEENVTLALRLRGWSHEEAQERAEAVLAWLGLWNRSRQRVARLSAGEAQRVALARALASARGLLVVDEPTSSLDEARTNAIAELLADAALSDGQTIICATHDPELIRHAHDVVELG